VLPRLRGITDGDSNAALAVCSALLLGVYHQRRTGEGQYVSTSMLGGNALAHADDFVAYAGKPALKLADPEKYGLHALYRLYQASEGWVFLAAPTHAEWEALAVGIDRPDLVGDPRFADAGAREQHDDELIGELTAVFATRAAAEWEQALAPKAIGCVEVFEGSRSEFVCTDPVLAETGLVVEVEHPYFGRMVRAAPCVSMSETPCRIAPGCLAGQHTRAILAELGYPEGRIAELLESRVVFDERIIPMPSAKEDGL
jgi:crotonobetainyl-CoA:carnitine CoA-transferase CaiB-like acyl-CoA transferase